MTEAEIKEQELDDLAIEVYNTSYRGVIPIFPWVLVRVLKKAQEQTKSGVILTHIGQNKTTYEGIVLATWVPFQVQVKTNRLSEAVGPLTHVRYSHEVISDGVTKRCTVFPGEHVLFPHWSGMPLEGMDKEHYRVVKSEGFETNGEGGILAVVEYDTIARRSENILRDEFLGNRVPEDVIQLILDRFILVDRQSESITLSGR